MQMPAVRACLACRVNSQLAHCGKSRENEAETCRRGAQRNNWTNYNFFSESMESKGRVLGRVEM